MKTFSAIFLGILSIMVGGCLSSAPRVPSEWGLSVADCAVSPVELVVTDGIASVTSVKVRSPYDRASFVVERKDGSVAFDPYNRFAAIPSVLIRDIAEDIAGTSGRFTKVVPSAGAARYDISIEVEVVRLALDCREENSRKAASEVKVRLVKNREVVAESAGSASVDAAKGDYGAAFSSALFRSVSSALSSLKVK